MKRNTSKKFPKDIYSFYMDNFPVLCADVVFLNKNKTKILLFKRNNKPLQGIYFTTGGNIRKGEKLKDSVVRITKEETGLSINPKKLILGGIINEDHKNSIFKGIEYNAVVLYWGYILENNSKIKLDNQHSDFKWFAIKDPKIHPFIKERISGVLKALKK